MSTVLHHGVNTAPLATPSRARDFLTLARSPAKPDRQRLLLSVLALCEIAPPPEDAISPALADILFALTPHAARDTRAALATTLARARWAPASLIHALAMDDIEIARPVIASSPILRDHDLLRVLAETTLEHRIEVARRPGLGAPVADALLGTDEPPVLTALAGNRSADISPTGLERLIDRARHFTGLRPALARHPRLTRALASRLHRWVGQALRQALRDRFQIEGPNLDQAAVAAVQAVWSPSPATLSTPERDALEARLVAKLAASGQLGPDYLLRAAREQRLGLFQHGLAALGPFPITQVRAALRSRSPEPLGLACAAVGIDRAALPTLLEAVRRLTGGFPAGGSPRLARFALSPQASANEFRALMAAR